MSYNLETVWRWLSYRIRRMVPDPVDHDYERRRRFEERRNRIDGAVARVLADGPAGVTRRGG